MSESPPSKPPVDDVETVVRAPADALERKVSAVGGVEPEPPRSLGRYAIVDEIGVGGMGRVLRAYDPQLDREVAIKVLRDVTSDARSRLRREAQAMAQLAHPNVLPIYDVADDGHRVFIAMELVRGRSVREWLKEGPHRWSEVLDVLVPAGRGLAAAHEAGLVHRDFKPANVLLGEDGRVRVMDFGLARIASGSVESSGVRSSSGSWSRGSEGGASDSDLHGTVTRSLHGALPHGLRATDSLDVIRSPADILTEAGEVLGTPAYMAPEQHVGQTIDHRCDQYAFCVTLWEALHGRRPFQAKTLAGWHQAKLIAPPKLDPARKVPRWLHAAVLRGLAPLPGDRFPSMDALLHTLAEGTRRHRRRRALGLPLAAVVLVAGMGSALHSTRRLCTGAEDKLAGIWDGGAAGEVEAAMLASDVGYAADTWARVGPKLDAYAARWQAAYQDACEATHVRHEQPEALMDARMRCLEDRRRDLRALVRTLAAADAELVERAVGAVGTLPAIEPCADPGYVHAQALPPADPKQAAEAEAIDEELARINALLEAGRGKQVEHDARAAVERAQALGHAPLEARARFRLGLLEDELGRYEASVEALEQAYFIAQREHLDGLQAQAAAYLVAVLGGPLGLPERAEQWMRHAEAALGRAHDPWIEASYLSSVGVLAMERGDGSEAIPLLERALALYERLGPDQPQVATVMSNLAVVHARRSRIDEARVLFERALDIRERTLAPTHPEVASALINLANVDLAQADPERARARLERALAIFAGAYGREHPEVAGTLLNLGNVHHQLGDSRRALASYEEALPVLESTQGADHPAVIGMLLNMGAVHHALGEPDHARERFERALRSMERTPGHELQHARALAYLAALAVEAGDLASAEARCLRALELLEGSGGLRHPVGMLVQTTLASVRTQQGRHDEALRLHRDALVVQRELFGEEHPETAASLVRLAQASIEAGEAEPAIGILEDAIEMLAGDGAEAAVGAEAETLHRARFGLARAWWDADRDRSEARELAVAARDGLAGMGGEYSEEIAEIEGWLAEHEDAKGGRRG